MDDVRQTSGVGLAALLLFWPVVLVAAVLVGFAVWYQSDGLRRWLWLALVSAIAIGLLVLQQRGDSRFAWCGLVIALGVAVLWWISIKPSNDRDWAPDVEHGVTAELQDGDALLHNIRDFDWRSETDFTPHWETRIYPIAALSSVDLISSVWSNPAIAHTLISFGFDDGRFVVFSAEIRKERHESFSELGGFFKMFELVLIAADERDILRLRTNIRHETVSMFRLRLTPEQRRALFLSFLDMGNRLAGTPEFYQTITSNCTTIIFKLARLIEPGTPLDWRILLSGYLPDYLYEHGIVDKNLPLEMVKQRALITRLGEEAGSAPDYSKRIRVAVP
ncbi:DUF4105 domain-containing protein [Beijerinckia indica]|uniref:Lnb N-terminal periplasmic domain-containing protein n=1 Tax=Beijerinckia indica subsp. indica (strain ATCC 9039 / DSM 1715 / NCIMB 8712) TaxID=395963 RepID=B2II08_BEII9|nr:DUF4105 domain-containing protein [Beijerinckia indica]ACB94591.1 conserved hypothetical protein [Beijerinckia indica subsp. indica ATCC 9039]